MNDIQVVRYGMYADTITMKQEACLYGNETAISMAFTITWIRNSAINIWEVSRCISLIHLE